VASVALLPEDRKRARLFFVSYFPLWVMVALRTLPAHHLDRWSSRWLGVAVFALLAGWSFLDGWRLISGAQETGPRRLYFSEVSSEGGNAAGYLATYLLPFLGIVPVDIGDWLAYGVYLFVALLVFIRSDLALVNPTLYLFRRRVVSARAYLSPEMAPDQQLGTLPVIVVCKDPSSLTRGPVDVVTLAGSFVTKNEPVS
jgi:hypothetical protein